LQQTGILLQQLLASFQAFAKYDGSLLSSNEALDQYMKSFNTMMVALKLGIQRCLCQQQWVQASKIP
jgi:hypothetical protein